jgi:hypothetical protein
MVADTNSINMNENRYKKLTNCIFFDYINDTNIFDFARPSEKLKGYTTNFTLEKFTARVSLIEEYLSQLES